jgi:hypothetical protein
MICSILKNYSLLWPLLDCQGQVLKGIYVPLYAKNTVKCQLSLSVLYWLLRTLTTWTTVLSNLNNIHRTHFPNLMDNFWPTINNHNCESLMRYCRLNVYVGEHHHFTYITHHRHEICNRKDAKGMACWKIPLMTHPGKYQHNISWAFKTPGNIKITVVTEQCSATFSHPWHTIICQRYMTAHHKILCDEKWVRNVWCGVWCALWCGVYCVWCIVLVCGGVCSVMCDMVLCVVWCMVWSIVWCMVCSVVWCAVVWCGVVLGVVWSGVWCGMWWGVLWCVGCDVVWWCEVCGVSWCVGVWFLVWCAV